MKSFDFKIEFDFGARKGNDLQMLEIENYFPFGA